MKIILSSLIFSFFFIGCSNKQEIVYKYKYVCYEQTKLQKLESVKIRIHQKDLDVATQYKRVIEDYFKFYENQIDRNNTNCKKLKKENEK
ncbi:hypothetical protein ACNSOP_09255 [Aliarcobacter lanthieri]|uniref:hypothetical protein n=1 Tax=Aliarcobacter lanthieri TaxID=1355374 RepID=UPI003AA91912